MTRFLYRLTAPLRWWRTTAKHPMPHGWGIAAVANMISATEAAQR